MEPAESTSRDEHWRNNFFRMSVFFGINHGCATTPLAYASSVLDLEVAYFGNGILYLTMLGAALIVAVPAVDRIGLHGSLVLSLAMYCVYVLSFSVAALLSSNLAQGCVFIIGSCCGGMAAGILWTAQGGYMAHTATAIATNEGVSRGKVTTELASQFAFYYLLSEEVCKIVFSWLLNQSMTTSQVGTMYSSLAIFCTACMARLVTAPAVTGSRQQQAVSKICEAVHLWGDARIWLLSPTNVAFGICAAYMNGYFNAEYAKPQLGVDSIGYLTACTLGASIVMTQVYGFLGRRYGDGLPLLLGSVCFGCIPLFVMVADVRQWGIYLVIIYLLQGAGRAVFESTNKAVLSDTFTGAKTEGAFANSCLQVSLAQALCFFFSGGSSGRVLEMVALVFATATPFAYLAKLHLDQRIASDSEVLPLIPSAKAA